MISFLAVISLQQSQMRVISFIAGVGITAAVLYAAETRAFTPSQRKLVGVPAGYQTGYSGSQR